MKVLEMFSKGIDKLSFFAGIVSGSLSVIITLIIFYAVILRYLFNSSLGWSDEFVAYLYVGHALLALGYATLHRQHVVAETFYVLLPAKIQFGVRMLGYTFVSMCSIIIIYYGFSMFWTYFAFGWRSDTPEEFILWPVMSMIPIGFLIFLLQCVSEVYKESKKIKEEGFVAEKGQ